MLRTYATWAEGAGDADVEAISRSMHLSSKAIDTLCREI
jgi:hypothetical protein